MRLWSSRSSASPSGGAVPVRGGAVMQDGCRAVSGRSSPLLNHSPLRTVRATFTAHGSSPYLLVRGLGCSHLRGTRVRLRSCDRIYHLPSRTSLPFPSGTHLTHVSTLSSRVLPCLPGYEFPLPFGWQHSLLGSSLSRWRFTSLAVRLLCYHRLHRAYYVPRQ